jgi:hypothetical protein
VGSILAYQTTQDFEAGHKSVHPAHAAAKTIAEIVADGNLEKMVKITKSGRARQKIQALRDTFKKGCAERDSPGQGRRSPLGSASDRLRSPAAAWP